MALFLAGVSPYVIMLLGRWSSDAFLRYLKKQVQEFNKNLSHLMTQTPAFHYVSHPSDMPAHRSSLPQHHHGPRLGGEAIQSAFAVWPIQI